MAAVGSSERVVTGARRTLGGRDVDADNGYGPPLWGWTIFTRRRLRPSTVLSLLLWLHCRILRPTHWAENILTWGSDRIPREEFLTDKYGYRSAYSK